MIENEISDYSRSKRMRSYTTWMEWDSYEEDYKWCIMFLLEMWIEGYEGKDDDWLFN